MSNMSDEQRRLLEALREGRVAPINFTSFARLLRADDESDDGDDYDESDDGDYDDDGSYDDGSDDDDDGDDRECQCCGTTLAGFLVRRSLCGPCARDAALEAEAEPEPAPADAPADGDDDGSDYW